MKKASFCKNENGRLFNDSFGLIALKSSHWKEGEEYEIDLNGSVLGIARLRIIREFPAIRLTDAVSLLTAGIGAAQLRATLAREINGNMWMPNETELYHLIFTYTRRNFDTQMNALHNWWNEKNQQHGTNTRA